MYLNLTHLTSIKLQISPEAVRINIPCCTVSRVLSQQAANEAHEHESIVQHLIEDFRDQSENKRTVDPTPMETNDRLSINMLKQERGG